jgi:hypothetical protein
MNTLQCMHTLLGHKSDIWCLQFDATQNLIVSGSGYEGAPPPHPIPIFNLFILMIKK